MWKELSDLSKEIWDIAELKYEETKSANRMTEFLREKGFEVKEGLANIPTAFQASYGSGSPVIGVLGEFDALSGLSQQADVAVPCPRPETDNGHGCGHHLLGVASIGAALKAKDYIEQTGQGTVIYYGCPAEEGGSAKAFMANAGVFDQLDSAITWHPFNVSGVFSTSSLANKQVYVRFKGVGSHAAMSPHLGRSALDALELVNVGVNFLREHIEDDDRIHYAITETGGVSPNVVQNNAEGIYLIRSPKSDRLNNLYKRFEKIVEGAALMTETDYEIVFDKSCSEYIPNRVLEKVLSKNLESYEPLSYSEEEIAYAKKFRDTYTEDDIKSDASTFLVSDKKEWLKKLNENVLADFNIPYQPVNSPLPGSTDVGDVSKVTPTAQLMVGCYPIGTPSHSWQLVAQGKSSIAQRGMERAGEVMGETIIDLLKNPETIKEAKAEFDEATKDIKDISLMPKDAMPLLLRDDK